MCRSKTQYIGVITPIQRFIQTDFGLYHTELIELNLIFMNKHQLDFLYLLKNPILLSSDSSLFHVFVPSLAHDPIKSSCAVHLYQHVPAFLRWICLHRTLGDTLSHCLHVYPPEGLTRTSVNSAGLKLTIRSVSVCGHQKIQSWASCLKRYKEIHGIPQRLHEGFGLRFKVKGKKLGDIWLNSGASSLIPLQILVLHCKHILQWGGGVLTRDRILHWTTGYLSCEESFWFRSTYSLFCSQ